MANEINNEIRVEFEQMGCMPCDMGVTAEIKTDAFGAPVYVIASYGPFGEIFDVSEVSYFDEDAFPKSTPIEEYEDFGEAMRSKYYSYFLKLDKYVDVKIAEYRLNH